MSEQNKMNEDGKNNCFYNQAHDWSRHYDSTLWTVTAIFIVANSALWTYAYDKDKFDLNLSIIGVFLTLISFFFAASFRALRRKLNNYLGKIGIKSEIQYLRSSHYIFKQWPVYLFIHFIFLGFWFEKIDEKTVVWWIFLLLSIFVLFFYYWAADSIKLSVIELDENEKKFNWKILVEAGISFIFALIAIYLIFHSCPRR